MDKLNLINGTTELELFEIGNKTMSSLEISELTNSRHDSVKRTIKKLVDKGLLLQTHLVDGHKSANNVVEKLYLSNKRDSLVIVARLCPEFMAKIVDRWQELEGNPYRALLDKINVVNKTVKLNGNMWGKAGVEQRKNKKIIKQYEKLVLDNLQQELELFLESNDNVNN